MLEKVKNEIINNMKRIVINYLFNDLIILNKLNLNFILYKNI